MRLGSVNERELNMSKKGGAVNLALHVPSPA